MKLKIVVDEVKDAIVVPEQAVAETQAGPVVYLVDSTGKVVVQRVEAAQTYEGIRIVTKGLDAGAKVIAEGLQLIRPGIAVKTEPANLTRQVREGTTAPNGRPAQPTAQPAKDEAPGVDPRKKETAPMPTEAAPAAKGADGEIPKQPFAPPTDTPKA